MKEFECDSVCSICKKPKNASKELTPVGKHNICSKCFKTVWTNAKRKRKCQKK